jgi:hypothetical protein
VLAAPACVAGDGWTFKAAPAAKHDDARRALKTLSTNISSRVVTGKHARVNQLVGNQLAKLS